MWPSQKGASLQTVSNAWVVPANPRRGLWSRTQRDSAGTLELPAGDTTEFRHLTHMLKPCSSSADAASHRLAIVRHFLQRRAARRHMHQSLENKELLCTFGPGRWLAHRAGQHQTQNLGEEGGSPYESTRQFPTNPNQNGM